MEDTTPGSNKASPLLNSPIKPIRWSKTLELGYSDAKPSVEPERVCFHCGKKPSAQEDEDGKTTKLLTCSKCHVATYCQKECQVSDWKKKGEGGSHKLACASLARVGPHMDFCSDNNNNNNSDQKKRQARDELFGRIRFYACPYAVTKGATLGRGFLFVQSGEHTLATMSLARPETDSYGRPVSPSMRSLLIHYLTLGEFDQEVVRADFELAAVRNELQTAVQTYDEEKEVVVLMRFRCGHIALGAALLVPDYQVCKKLGQDYFADDRAGALQLNLDDV